MNVTTIVSFDGKTVIFGANACPASHPLSISPTAVQCVRFPRPAVNVRVDDDSIHQRFPSLTLLSIVLSTYHTYQVRRDYSEYCTAQTELANHKYLLAAVIANYFVFLWNTLCNCTVILDRHQFKPSEGGEFPELLNIVGLLNPVMPRGD